MPNPSRSQVHVNRPLTMMSLAYAQAAEGFIADRVFPVIPVSKQADAYFIYNRADFNRNQMRKRAPGTESAGGGYNLTTDTYFADVWAFHKDIDDQTRANYDEPLSADREANIFVTNKALINREVQWAAKFFGTGIWGKDVAGAASGETAGTSIRHWSDAAGSDPITDIEYYRMFIKQATGYKPNTLVLGSTSWSTLKNHPDMLDRVKYSGGTNAPAVVTNQALAALFEVERILIADAIVTDETSAYSQEPAAFQNDANPDVQKFIVGAKAGLLCYVPPAPGIMTPGAGYTFAWTGYMGANSWGGAVSNLRMDNLKSDRIEIESAYAQKVVGKDLGVYFSALVA